MKLADLCSSSFESQIRKRGASYAHSGLVSLTSVDPVTIQAEVQGSSGAPYEVTVDLESCEDGILVASCTCPYYEGAGLCKHIWAVLRSVETDDVYLDATKSSRLEVIEDDEEQAWMLDDLNDWGLEDEEEWGHEPPLPFTLPARGGGPSESVRESWHTQLQAVGRAVRNRRADIRELWERASGKRREAWYLLNPAESRRNGRLAVDLFRRETKKDGELGKPRALSLGEGSIQDLTDDEDRWLLEMLTAVHPDSSFPRPYFYSPTNVAVVPAEQQESLLPRLCATGRLICGPSADETFDDANRLVWDDGPAYRFRMEVIPDDAKKRWKLQGLLYRGKETVPLGEPVLLLRSGIAAFDDRLARFDDATEFAWVALLRKQDEITVPYSDRLDFLAVLHGLETLPEVELPETLRLREVSSDPHPILRIRKPNQRHEPRELCADVLFDYEGIVVPVSDARPRIVSKEDERVLLRNGEREAEFLRRLAEWNMRPAGHRYYGAEADLSFLARRLDEVVAALTREGWLVEAEGFRVRQAGAFSGGVTSGIDWFDLEGQFDYGEGAVASLPDLLEAVRQGQNYVQLSDGSRGLLPEKWLARFGSLAEMGEPEDGKVRFRPSQAAILDALLAAQDNVSADRTFTALQKRLRSFEGIRPQKQPRGFSGQLREYQRQGLGWLDFLETFHFGGCLADDMGLGKTIQVLALLQKRRAAGKNEGPSLIVVPRSLVFNWLEEAARFSPRIRLRNYTGQKRSQQLEELEPGEVLVTTYGTLRRDILKLKEIDFDYVILDEAQAIKNPKSQAAKSARLLQARERLALTGTPVENHLGELWSLFEFLNPGMLGRSSVFQKCWKNGQTDTDQVERLRAALAPFVLRRTKEQVLTELPEKMEQTLYCELDRRERKAYDEIRKYYRDSLQKKIDERGLKRSKIHVLEALLRLRQAACHRGLLDEKHARDSSAKLETLLEQVAEIAEEGHKALVFSQFTSLLAIVKQHLDDRGVPYEYLDGRTRKRGAKVARFQDDPDCRLFLISLKAGGHGLNLTAADYVFILDPWWNPAVEAQAVDRAHRIGQSRPVFAYRLIARDTVEEKILQLQKSKRDLAEAILASDGSLVQKLTADDLQLLLS